jgi:hypothetical protein
MCLGSALFRISNCPLKIVHFTITKRDRSPTCNPVSIVIKDQHVMTRSPQVSPHRKHISRTCMKAGTDGNGRGRFWM